MNEPKWRKTPPRWQAIGAAVLSAALFLYLRMFIYSEAVVPLTYALPLLLTLWHRDLVVHYALAAAFTVMAGVKLFVVAPHTPDEMSPLTAFLMMQLNIWTVAIVVDRLLRTQQSLKTANDELAQANAELEASNEELAAREEEISSQNEELQRQAEEMEHQMEEMQELSEELQQQSEELQELQHLAAAREQVLQSLFNISTGLGRDGQADDIFERICEATAQAFGDSAMGTVLVESVGSDLVIRGHCGLEQSLQTGEVFRDAFARLVVEQAKTACVEDLQKTPDIFAPILEGREARAVIAAPLVRQQKAWGLVLVYSAEPRAWAQSDFQTVQWLVAQGSLLLEAMNLQHELDRRSREAEDASRRKTQFLAAVSHDVRTPANAINLMAEVMELARTRPELAEDVPDMIARLRQNTKQLVELVSDVLDISRLDSGKIELELSTFDFCKLIEREIENYRPMAASAGLQLECDIPPESIWIRTDRIKLIRVIENLVGNAIKFTERGQVTVQVARTDDGVELRVKDTGVGIPHDHLEHIFDEFFQVKNPERDRSKGTGLGLAICRRLIEALGCSLSVRSQLGLGSTFAIRMPHEMMTAAPLETALPDAREQRPDLHGVRILLVEDHESTRISTSRLLALHGAQVEQAADARTAIQMLRRSEAEVLLLDLMLPDLDGREVLRQLQAGRPDPLRCVLVVSGDVGEERRREVLHLGADGIVAKPIDIKILVRQIASLVCA